MATKRNAFSSLIRGILEQHPLFFTYGWNPDHFIGFHFLPTSAEVIEIVRRKNAGEVLLPIYKEDDHLFQRQPEQLEECHCFTKLTPVGRNKVSRTFGEGSDSYRWRNIKAEPVRDDNNNMVIGWVTKLVLHTDNNTPTEWHILEYRDRKTPDAGRWVLCQIYKREKNNDSGSPSSRDPSIDNTTVLPVASDVEAGQISSTSQVLNMWSSGASEDMNQGHHYETGQCSYTQPDRFFNAATYAHQLTGEHMNQDQIHGVDQPLYTPQDGMVYNNQQFRSSPNSIDDFFMVSLDEPNSIEEFPVRLWDD